MPDAPSGSFLTQKAGPLPVYAWAGAGLGVALLISRFRTAKAGAAGQQDQATAYSSYANQPEGTIPQFIIQNQLPYVPSAPVATVPTAPPVVVGPGRSVTPPITHTPPPEIISAAGAAASAAQAAAGAAATRAATPARQPQWYTIQHNDNYSSIASRFGTTADAIFKYNTTPGNRSAESIAKFRNQGPNLIYAGQTLLIP